jgi:hypothetical protein
VREHRRIPDHTSPSEKGDDMAASKDNRASGCETNPFFLELFRDRSDSDERERTWHTAMAHAGEGMPPLRFPVYETLYQINVHAQKLVDLLEEVSVRFGIDHESLEYHQSLIQFVRAVASQSIAEYMNDVEVTEEWLFERQRVVEENKLRDPDDVYISVRQREAERLGLGLAPRIRFLDQTPAEPVSEPTDPPKRKAK